MLLGKEVFVDGNDGNKRLVGCLVAVAQAIAYSTMGIFGKLLYATGFDAQQTVILRFFCTTVLLGAFMLIWRKEPLVSRQKDVYVQAIFYFVSAFSYFLAVERMNAGIVTVFFYLFPVIVALINMIVFRERLAPLTVAALVLTLAGLVFISGILSGALVFDAIGVACALFSALTFAIYTVLIQKAGRTEGSFTVTFTLSWTSLLGACIFFAPSVPTLFAITPYQLALGCTIAVVNTILPVVLYIQAIKLIGGTMSSLISISETPFSLLLAFLVLGETITATEGVGIVLIVAGVVLVTAAPLFKR